MAHISLYTAAIDFGTTFSGIAFSLRGSEEVYCKEVWPSSPTGSEGKAPTVVLFKPNKEFKSFGYEAKDDFASLSCHEQKQCYYFEKFKMELHKQDKFDMNQLLETTNNPGERKLPIITVFSEVMKYFKKELVELIKDVAPKGRIEVKDIHWVVTVPAIWKAQARQMMREAAIKAQLIGKNPLDLTIALEPEGAALAVNADTINKHKKYIIIDCGGGTIDICVHERVKGVSSDSTIRELSLPSGGGWGGIYVDKMFSEFLEKIFSPECITYIKDQNMQSWYEIVESFQIVKRNFNAESPISLKGLRYEEKGTKKIPCPFEFVRLAEECHGKKFDQILEGHKDVQFSRGSLHISCNAIKSFFAGVITKILTHVQQILHQNAGVDALYLVGGFATSSILQNAIKYQFEKDYKIVIPLKPQNAVVKGAILYGKNPYVISERISAVTYGIEVSRPFNPSEHDAKYKFKSKDGFEKCGSLFCTMVERGNLITEKNHKYTQTLTPLNKDDTRATILIYTTEKKMAKYTDENGVLKVGRVSHEFPNPHKGFDRSIKVELDFSGTEIIVSVTTSENDNISYATIDFLGVDSAKKN